MEPINPLNEMPLDIAREVAEALAESDWAGINVPNYEFIQDGTSVPPCWHVTHVQAVDWLEEKDQD